MAWECMRREEWQGVVLSAGRGRGAGNEGTTGEKIGWRCVEGVALCFSPSKPLSLLAVRVTGKCSTCIYPNHEPFLLIFCAVWEGGETGWVALGELIGVSPAQVPY